jgi:hypothetical protein
MSDSLAQVAEVATAIAMLSIDSYVFGILWVDPEPVLFILIISQIPGRPIRTGTGEPCRLKRVRAQSRMVQ